MTSRCCSVCLRRSEAGGRVGRWGAGGRVAGGDGGEGGGAGVEGGRGGTVCHAPCNATRAPSGRP